MASSEPLALRRCAAAVVVSPPLQQPGAPGVSHELNAVRMDHCYSRPRLVESRFLRPTRTLFVPRRAARKSPNPLAPRYDLEDVIDVETVPPDPPIVYDSEAARRLMGECERHAAFARPNLTVDDDDSCDDWEVRLLAIGSLWTPTQKRIFDCVAKILNSEYLTRLAIVESYNEPIVRRNAVQKSVSRFRRTMSSINWDTKISQWLHLLLIDNLPTTYLGIYLDLLQTLKAKCPLFTDKLMHAASSVSRVGLTSNEGLFPLLMRPWDPVAPSLAHDKPKKLPGNPVIVIVPSSPSSNSLHFKRLHRWVGLLSNLATVVPVYANIGSNAHRMTMTNCLDQMLATTRAVVQEVREDYPGRSVILAGFNAGASLALQVAQVESILCVLCLGFSLLTAEGKRGDPDDNLLELQCPVLFVVGQCSNTSSQEDMEDLRERMRVETGLVVVGAADDYLRVDKKRKRAESITQSVVDRCIVDEVGEFISGLLLSPYPPQIRLSPAHIPEANKSPGADRKRNNSVDGDQSSPRITRPVGRPPGTKSKSRSRWSFPIRHHHHHHHHLGGAPPPPPPPPDPFSRGVPRAFAGLHPKFSQLAFGAGMHHARNVAAAAPPKQPQQAQPPPSASSASSASASEIRVLEDVVLNSGAGKLINAGREIDISKITLLGPVGAYKAGASAESPPQQHQHQQQQQHSGLGIEQKGKSYGCSTSKELSKYITSKKQLLNNPSTKPPKPKRYHPYPTTNLTSHDIMNLPIIFADDNQMLADNVIQPSDAAPPAYQQAIKGVATATAAGKQILFVNKQVGQQLSASIKRPLQQQQQQQQPQQQQQLQSSSSNSIKYAKIILSKRVPVASEEGKGGGGGTTVELARPPMQDIESQLVATSLPNPKFMAQEAEKKKAADSAPDDAYKSSKAN